MPLKHKKKHSRILFNSLIKERTLKMLWYLKQNLKNRLLYAIRNDEIMTLELEVHVVVKRQTAYRLYCAELKPWFLWLETPRETYMTFGVWAFAMRSNIMVWEPTVEVLCSDRELVISRWFRAHCQISVPSHFWEKFLWQRKSQKIFYLKLYPPLFGQ